MLTPKSQSFTCPLVFTSMFEGLTSMGTDMGGDSADRQGTVQTDRQGTVQTDRQGTVQTDRQGTV